ncbi:RNA pseudouridine synthase, partial [bacterium]|nr:RNA pseudouridine synthase [bacterium]
LAAHPLTGRTHQIRVHLEHLRHPVLGDSLYGLKGYKSPSGQVQKALKGVNGFCLHSGKLTLTHPSKGKVLTINAPLPADMRNVINALELTDAENSDWRILYA